MRRTNCRDDEILQELRIGAGADDGFCREGRADAFRRLVVDQRAFMVFIRTKCVACESGADFFTDHCADLAARRSVHGPNRHRSDVTAIQATEKLLDCSALRSASCSTRLLSAA